MEEKKVIEVKVIKEFIIKSINDIDSLLVKHSAAMKESQKHDLKISADTYRLVLKKILEFSKQGV